MWDKDNAECAEAWQRRSAAGEITQAQTQKVTTGGNLRQRYRGGPTSFHPPVNGQMSLNG